jgi:hypothetical protein
VAMTFAANSGNERRLVENVPRWDAWEARLNEIIGLDPVGRKPLLYFAFDSSLFPDELYEILGNKLDKLSDHLPWIKQHPFLFSLCLVRRFFEKSDGRFNLFGARVDKLLNTSFDGVFQSFDSDCDRRFNVHKVLGEAFFFFGAKTSKYYDVLSHIRQEFDRADSVEDAYREIQKGEIDLPFAYEYLLGIEDTLFRELICETHTENARLQEITTRHLSKILKGSSANIGWAINWSSKKLDILIERLVLDDSRVTELLAKCDGQSYYCRLAQLRHETKNHKRCFPTIRVSELFERNLPFWTGCEISFGSELRRAVNALCGDEAPMIFRKVGDVARLWTPPSNSKDEIVRATEFVLLKSSGRVQEVRLGDRQLLFDRKTISLGNDRYDAVLVHVTQQKGENAEPFIIDGEQLCKVGVRPRFEIVEEASCLLSNEGDLFTVGENIGLQLNTHENLDENNVKVDGVGYSVTGSLINLEGLIVGQLVRIGHDKTKTRILRLPQEHDKIAREPMLAIDGLWKPYEPAWSTPGKTSGTLSVGQKQYEAWVPWTRPRFAWKKLGVGHVWEHGRIRTFSSLGNLAEYCVELWLPCRGTLKLAEAVLLDCEEGLNNVRFDTPEMKQTLRVCMQNIALVGSDSSLVCQLGDGECLNVADVTLEPVEPILIKTETAAFSVYVPRTSELSEWNVCILDEQQIAKPVRWRDLTHGRNDFCIELAGQCCWVVLCKGCDWKTGWIDFLVQAAGRKPVEVLPFVPDQRAPIRDRLRGVENAGEQLGIIKGLLVQFDPMLFKETLIDAASGGSGVCVSRISRSVARQMFSESLSFESIEQKVDQLLLAGFNVFSIRSGYEKWIENICGKWTQGEQGTVAQLWQKCAWFPAMELFRNRFPVLGQNSNSWKKFYSGTNDCNQKYLKRALQEYFPASRVSLYVKADPPVLTIWEVEESLGKIRVQIEKSGMKRPIYFGTWRRTIQLPMREVQFSLYNVDENDIYPLMSDEPYGESEYRNNKKASMYLSKKMYQCAYYEACSAKQLVFSADTLQYLYELLMLELNVCIGRDKVLNEILTRCYQKYRSDQDYANRLAVLILAAFSRRRYCFSDDDHQVFMDGMLQAYRECRRLLMNDLMAVEFFRVWFSQKLGVVDESN